MMEVRARVQDKPSFPLGISFSKKRVPFLAIWLLRALDILLDDLSQFRIDKELLPWTVLSQAEGVIHLQIGLGTIITSNGLDILPSKLRIALTFRGQSKGPGGYLKGG